MTRHQLLLKIEKWSLSRHQTGRVGNFLIDKIKQSINRLIYFQNKVPVSKIYYSPQKCYVEEGFGGQQIILSPLYRFFKTYIEGEKQLAINAFCVWYQEQFNKFYNVSKSQGGMYKGSLYRLIVKNHQKANKNFLDLKNADQEIIEHSIRQRVEQRFALADQIIKYGYKTDYENPIRAVKENGKFFLQGGHHRVCILAALGHKFIPNVYIKNGRLLQRLLKFFS